MKGHAEFNNKLLKLSDANKPTIYIIYLDANNLYGHSMIEPFSTKIIGDNTFFLIKEQETYP